MRWKTEPKSNRGDYRTITRFAWLPKRMHDDVTVIWLERYKVWQEYVEVLADHYLWIDRYNEVNDE